VLQKQRWSKFHKLSRLSNSKNSRPSTTTASIYNNAGIDFGAKFGESLSLGIAQLADRPDGSPYSSAEQDLLMSTTAFSQCAEKIER
jgi:hypothetical protein